jgi:hypothetical protein
MSIKKSSDLIENRTRDLPAYSILPQLTTLPRPPTSLHMWRKFLLLFLAKFPYYTARWTKRLPSILSSLSLFPLQFLANCFLPLMYASNMLNHIVQDLPIGLFPLEFSFYASFDSIALSIFHTRPINCTRFSSDSVNTF